MTGPGDNRLIRWLLSTGATPLVRFQDMGAAGDCKAGKTSHRRARYDRAGGEQGVRKCVILAVIGPRLHKRVDITGIVRI